VSSQLHFELAMVGSVLVLFSGLVGVTVFGDDALGPLGWLFLVIGALAVAGNLFIRQRLQ
jgi:hypothetical protein